MLAKWGPGEEAPDRASFTLMLAAVPIRSRN